MLLQPLVAKTQISSASEIHPLRKTDRRRRLLWQWDTMAIGKNQNGQKRRGRRTTGGPAKRAANPIRPGTFPQDGLRGPGKTCPRIGQNRASRRSGQSRRRGNAGSIAQVSPSRQNRTNRYVYANLLFFLIVLLSDPRIPMLSCVTDVIFPQRHTRPVGRAFSLTPTRDQFLSGWKA